MKKNALKTVLAVILTIVLGTSVAFAAQVPSDVKGQSCETAVNALMDAGVITGDVDGLFHPDSTLTRAQVCIMVARVIDKDIAADADAGALGNKFSDMEGYGWAAGAIGLMADKKYAAGYTDGTFKPGADVSVAELLTFVMRACGDKYSDSNIGGTWPANYISAACALGIIDASELADDVKGTKPATKAQAAEVIYKAFDYIQEANGSKKPDVDPDPIVPDNFSGKIYGVINDVEIVQTKDGIFPEIKILTAGKESVVTAKKGIFSENEMAVLGDKMADYAAKGELIELVSSKGKITAINVTAENNLKAKYCVELTTGSWTGVLDINKTKKHIKLDINNENKYIGYKENAVVYFYDADDKAYETRSITTINKNCSIRAYDLTDDDVDSADIIIVTKSDNVTGTTPGIIIIPGQIPVEKIPVERIPVEQIPVEKIPAEYITIN